MTEEVNSGTFQCDQHSLPEKGSESGGKELLPESNIFNMSAFPDMLSWLKISRCWLWKLLFFHYPTLQHSKSGGEGLQENFYSTLFFQKGKISPS